MEDEQASSKDILRIRLLNAFNEKVLKQKKVFCFLEAIGNGDDHS